MEEIEKQKHTLVNHFNAGVTHMAKNNAWVDILRKVNAVTTCPRELPEVKKKWSDMKTEVRRKVAQARAAIEGTSADCTPVPVILTAMQQRICNLLGEATIISLPAGDSDAEMGLPVTVSTATTVTLAESKERARTATVTCNAAVIKCTRRRGSSDQMRLYSQDSSTHAM